MAVFWRKYKESILMLLVTMLLLCAGIVFQGRISVIMEADMEEKLLEVNAQIRNAMDEKLESGFAVLHAVSAALENGAGEPFLSDQRERNEFTSLGAVKLDGRGLFGPDFPMDELPLLTEAFRGNERLAWLEGSPFGDEDCVFMAVPFMRGERVMGAVYAISDGRKMLGFSSPDIFDGQGISMVVGQNFRAALPNRLPPDSKLSTDSISQQLNREAGERIKCKLYRSRRGVEKFIVDERETYFACVPFHAIPGWYVLTSIPATVVLKKIQTVILLMSLVVLGLCCALLALIWALDLSRRQTREKLFNLAYTDRITGISNWEGLLRQGSPGERYALAVLDIDEFHIVNSLLGGEACDRLLRRIAEMLLESVEGVERACRVEADRFGLLLVDDTRLEERLQNLMDRTSALAPGFCLTLSAGVVRLSQTPMELSEALECCVLAEKLEKRQKQHVIAYYSDGMKAGQRRNRTLVSDLPCALSEGEILVYLQPKVWLADGKLAGAEALIRWQHPAYGFLLPEDFVPLLEDTGTATRLDFYVLRAVCGMLEDWRGKGLPLLPVSVNLSRVHLANVDLAEDIWQITKGTPPELIELEIEEKALYGDSDRIIELSERLRAKGFSLAVNNLGVGCSMVELLPRLLVETVKLDHGLLEAPGVTTPFLTDIVAMIHHLGYAVLGKGVECAGQAQMLVEAGCELGQGFYYAPPMPPEGYERLLKSGRRLPHE